MKKLAPLAKQPGATEEHIEARRTVATAFYARSDPDKSAADIHSHVKAIDLTKPVEVVDIPKGTTMYQWTRGQGGKVGQYFTVDEKTTPDKVGASMKVFVGADKGPPLVDARVEDRSRKKMVAEAPTEGLKTTGAPIYDFWSTKSRDSDLQGMSADQKKALEDKGMGKDVRTVGGGTQVVVPGSAVAGFKVEDMPKKGGK